MAQLGRDVMTRNPVTLPATRRCVRPRGRCGERDTGDLLVRDGDRLAGIVTDRDLVVRALADRWWTTTSRWAWCRSATPRSNGTRPRRWATSVRHAATRDPSGRPAQTRPLAVVTGASTGIGRELAKEFARHGHDVVIAAENAELDDTHREVMALGAQVRAVRGDLARYQFVQTKAAPELTATIAAQAVQP